MGTLEMGGNFATQDVKITLNVQQTHRAGLKWELEFVYVMKVFLVWAMTANVSKIKQLSIEK